MVESIRLLDFPGHRANCEKERQLKQQGQSGMCQQKLETGAVAPQALGLACLSHGHVGTRLNSSAKAASNNKAPYATVQSLSTAKLL